MRLIRWFSSWATTLHIMLFERDTYRILRDKEEFGLDDFVEISSPRDGQEPLGRDSA